MENVWTDLIPFNHLFEYYGLINEEMSLNKPIMFYEGKTGTKHSDNGFRLRSKVVSSKSSFYNIPLQKSLEELPCELNKNDRGVYWICIKLEDGSYWDYIGEAGGQSIYDRILHHLIKIVGTTEFNSSTVDTENYKAFRQYIKDNKINFDITKDLRISFIKLKNSKDIKKRVHKIEARAIERFKQLYGTLPKLNSRNELSGMDGFGNCER